MNNQMAGKLIKELRVAKQVSMSDFAKNIHISQPSLSRIESGNQELTFNLLVKICEQLGMTITEFSFRLEESNKLYSTALRELVNAKNEGSKDLDEKLKQLLLHLTDEQKKGLYVLLFPYKDF